MEPEGGGYDRVVRAQTVTCKCGKTTAGELVGFVSVILTAPCCGERIRWVASVADERAA